MLDSNGHCYFHDSLRHSKCQVCFHQDISKIFHLICEIFKGPTLARNDVIIAVNWTGLYVVDDQEQVLLELSFPEITDISRSKIFFPCKYFFKSLILNSNPAVSKGGQPIAPQIVLYTAQGTTMTFNTPNADDLKELLGFMLTELRRLSRFTVALQNYIPKGNKIKK